MKYRIFDNGGETIDRFTVVYDAPGLPYVAMNGAPYHPQGFCQHGELGPEQHFTDPLDHLGREVLFIDLPEDCQRQVCRELIDFEEVSHD